MLLLAAQIVRARADAETAGRRGKLINDRESVGAVRGVG